MKIRQSEHLCRKECQKCPPPHQKKTPQGQEVKLAKQNFLKILVFPIDVGDLAIIPLSAKNIQHLYKPRHCGFMQKSQGYGMT